MNVHPDCVPCLMKRVLFQSKLPNNGREEEAVGSALRTYAKEISFEKNSAKVATLVHRSAYDAMGVEDPYLDLKIRADEVAELYMDDLEKVIADSEDPLSTAIRISIIGNIMDFGSGIAIEDPNEFKGIFSKLLSEDVDSNDAEEMVALLKTSSSAVFIFDNCGESQIDKLLLREIRKLGVRVVGVVRGKPILNDVSVDDAKRIGLDREVDELMTTGGFAIGIDMDMIQQDLKDEIQKADIIITKGMANYESLSDIESDIPIVFILKAKCQPVADSLGVRLGDNVVRLKR